MHCSHIEKSIIFGYENSSTTKAFEVLLVWLNTKILSASIFLIS